MPWDARLDFTTRLVKVTSTDTDGTKVTELKRLRFYFVDLVNQSGVKLTFPISRRKNTFTFRDERECATGSVGSAGLWGTREASRSGAAKLLTPTAWVNEVSRLVGRDRAEGVVQEYLAFMAEAKAKWEATQLRRVTARVK